MVKLSPITHGGKAESSLPSPSQLTPEILTPASHPPWWRGDREVQGDTGTTSSAKTHASSDAVLIGDTMSCVQAGNEVV